MIWFCLYYIFLIFYRSSWVHTLVFGWVHVTHLFGILHYVVLFYLSQFHAVCQVMTVSLNCPLLISISLLFTNFGYHVQALSKHFLIEWISSYSMLSVPDENYSRNASSAINLISPVLLIIVSYRHRTLFSCQ